MSQSNEIIVHFGKMKMRKRYQKNLQRFYDVSSKRKIEKILSFGTVFNYTFKTVLINIRTVRGACCLLF